MYLQGRFAPTFANQLPHGAGTDVMIKKLYFNLTNSRFLIKLHTVSFFVKSHYCLKKHLFFEKWEESHKIAIITSTPGF
jgi:hypothetical protein